MVLTYTNNEDDIYVWQLYVYRHVSKFQNQVRTTRLISTLFGMLIHLFGLWQGSAGFTLIGLFWMPLFYIGTPKVLEWAAKRNFKRMNTAENLSKRIGKQTLELQGDVLIEKMEKQSSQLNISKLYDVVEIDTHYFVRLSPQRGYVIPKDKITRGDADLFISTLAAQISE